MSTNIAGPASSEAAAVEVKVEMENKEEDYFGQGCVNTLKATMSVPTGLHVKSIAFVREGNNWRGQLEVK